MQNNGKAVLRVMVASENCGLREQIAEMVEREPGVTVVGEVGSAVEAMSLARRIKPEVTVVDPHLPYHFGIDGIPLSRMSGLDTAIGVTQELPGMAVVVANPDLSLKEYGLESNFHLCRYTGDFRVPLHLAHLQFDAAPADRVVFAGLWVDETTPLRSRALELSDQLLVWGGLSVVGGFALMLTLVMLYAGIPLAGGGLAAIMVGLAIKGAARFVPSSLRRRTGGLARPVKEVEHAA